MLHKAKLAAAIAADALMALAVYAVMRAGMVIMGGIDNE